MSTKTVSDRVVQKGREAQEKMKKKVGGGWRGSTKRHAKGCPEKKQGGPPDLREVRERKWEHEKPSNSGIALREVEKLWPPGAWTAWGGGVGGRGEDENRLCLKRKVALALENVRQPEPATSRGRKS